jgi:hypothetical protein
MNFLPPPSDRLRGRLKKENPMFKRTTAVIWCLAALWVVTSLGDDQPQSIAADKQALAALQDYIGAWKGVGQPRRGFAKDAWIEQADWAWKFADGRASLVFDSPQGKYYHRGELHAGSKAGEYELVAILPDGKTQERFTGKLNNGQLTLHAAEPAAGRPASIGFRQVADGKRLIATYWQKTPGLSLLTPLAEVGYTRKGSNFGKGGGGPECVVTGGYGSMAVEHEGQTYYVCCTGCRELFNDEPAAVIADYRARKAAEREKKPQ